MSKSIKLLQAWINKTIIDLNLCPFAKASLDDLSISESKFFDERSLTEKVLSLSEKLKQVTSSNAIIYFEEDMSFKDLFKSSIDYEDILNSIGYKIKVIAFHPNFIFEGLDFEDKANYVNRSPIPLFHLIPINLIEKARIDNTGAKNISINNELKIKDLDKNKLDEYFFYMDNK